MRRIGSRFIAPIGCLAVVVLGACTTENTNSSEGTPPPGDAFVEVLLDEFTIAMPDEVVSGTISFEISNTGEMDHSFAIEGPSIEGGDQLDDALAPTATFVYTAELEPGTYTVWCPIGDHRERGMEATIEVTEAAASQGEGEDEGNEGGQNLSDEGVTSSEGQAPITDDYTAP